MKKSIFNLSTVATVLGALFITQSAYSMDPADEGLFEKSKTQQLFNTKVDDPTLKGKTLKLEVLKDSPFKEPLTLLMLKEELPLILQFCPYTLVNRINVEFYLLAHKCSIVRFSRNTPEWYVLEFAGNPSIIRMPNNISSELLQTKFSNIHEIELGNLSNINVANLKSLSNLRTLSLRNANQIKDISGIARHTQINTLRCNHKLTDEELLNYPELTELSLGNSQEIIGYSLQSLPKLTSLNLEANITVTHEFVAPLTNLKRLICGVNNNIDASLLKLPSLEVLDISRTTNKIENGLPNLSHLTRLRGSFDNISEKAAADLEARGIQLQWLY